VTGRRLGRAAVTLLVALLVGVLGAAPAAAHNRIVGSDPADGATIVRTPDAVALTFTEPAVGLGTRVVVTGPDGTASTGAAELVDATVRQPLVPGAPAGTYAVAWRVTSADGHPITGELTFTAEAAGRGEYPGPAAAPPAVEQSGAPAWSWVLLALALLGGAGALAVLRRRRRGPQG
jgi:methionine-rich copper-binding protein CopC